MVNHKDLVFVGWTNGSQILYGAMDEGMFFNTGQGDCYIPLYMLKAHLHRIETTSGGRVTAEEVKEAREKFKPQ